MNIMREVRVVLIISCLASSLSTELCLLIENTLSNLYPHCYAHDSFILSYPSPFFLSFLQISNHFKLHHPHIVSLHNVTLYGDNLVLEMEAMHGGDMQQFMQRFPRGMPEHVARWYFQQIVLAVDYCHKKVRIKTTT